MCLWKRSERESRRVEGGSVYSVHVLFVNRPIGKRDTRLYSSQSTQGHKARSGGRWGKSVRGNSICACMYVWGQSVRAMEAVSIREWATRENEQSSEEDQRGRES